MPTIAILHGYLLDGSGSNVWTGSIVRGLCREGATVHLMCQEPHPERFDFVAEAFRYDESGSPNRLFHRDVRYPGRCILHKPDLGGLLPVYVGDTYEEHKRPVRMTALEDREIDDYIRRNVIVLERILADHPIEALLANHVVLMPVVALRAVRERPIPFLIVPHGSAIEYVVKPDRRFQRLAAAALTRASGVLVIGPEMRGRLIALFPEVTDLEGKMTPVRLGVDTDLFAPCKRRQRRSSIEMLSNALRIARQDASLSALTAPLRTRPDDDCETKLTAIDWDADRIVLFVGRLIAAKGIQAVIAAWPAILEEIPNARLVIVGHGPLRPALETMLQALQSDQREAFLDSVAPGRVAGDAGDDEPFVHVQRYLSRRDRRGELDDYLAAARRHDAAERVVFTGYLRHDALRYLFPCSDVALFPSIVREAGPLVFLESLASGVLPVGINQGGLAASIDSLSDSLPAEVMELMKLRADPENLVEDIVARTTAALTRNHSIATALRSAAVARHDWRVVSRDLLSVVSDAIQAIR